MQHPSCIVILCSRPVQGVNSWSNVSGVSLIIWAAFNSKLFSKVQNELLESRVEYPFPVKNLTKNQKPSHVLINFYHRASGQSFEFGE